MILTFVNCLARNSVIYLYLTFIKQDIEAKVFSTDLFQSNLSGVSEILMKRFNITSCRDGGATSRLTYLRILGECS